MQTNSDRHDIRPRLVIDPPGPEQIRMIGIHAPSGHGKTTCAIDILLHAWEQGWVEGFATNVSINTHNIEHVCNDGHQNKPFRYQNISYLTELPDIRNLGNGLDELNRVLDGRDWQDELRSRFVRVIDNSRRHGNRIVVATSIRETGVDRHLRGSITIVIAPMGIMSDGYPLYRVFADYFNYERYLNDPDKAEYYVCRGFHTVAYLKTLFDSTIEPRIQAYPPLIVEEEAQKFVEWGGPFLYNGDGKLVSLPKLNLHVSRWNLTTREIPFKRLDLNKMLSYLYAEQDRRGKEVEQIVR